MPRYPRETAETKKVEKILKQHFSGHPDKFPPKAYRYNIASIRLRLVDECFRGKDLIERHDLVRPVLRTLPDKTRGDIMLVLLFTPEEVEDSLANVEFEHPDPVIFSNGRVRRK